jgi:uncharacterized membrane protein
MRQRLLGHLHVDRIINAKRRLIGLRTILSVLAARVGFLTFRLCRHRAASSLATHTALGDSQALLLILLE